MKGYIHIYTGNGKGKTTAALGLALRAAGHKKKTIIIQFMKGMHYGELDSIRQFLSEYIVIEQFGAEGFVHVDKATPEDIQRARNGLKRAYEAFKQKYDIIILDELNVAIFFKLLSKEEVLDLINHKPADKELIITGRYAPDYLIDIADLVTEMKEIKHYYQQGVEARDGIEK